MKVWVLTGDKLETALNISHSCGHFKQGMEIMSITQELNEEDIKGVIEECKKMWVVFHSKINLSKKLSLCRNPRNC